jgi:plastocyanin
MDQLWTSLLNLIDQLVSPDWGSLIALVPLGLLLVIVAFLLWVVMRYAGAGPKRRGKRRLPPRPPAGVHAAETSWAPVLAALGAVGLLGGLVYRGWFLVIGVIILVLALLYWLREGIRDYDHVEHPVTALVPVTAGGPPPGIHMPGPSFRPIVASLAMAALLYGFVMGSYLLVAGALMLAIALLQWLVDARREYRGVVIADVTGHLPADPRPSYPRRTLATFAVLFVGAVVLQTGILPPKAAVGSGGTPSAAPSGAPASGGPGPSGGSGGPGPAADVTVHAQNIQFDGGNAQISAAAGKPFTIAFDNEDAGTPHNIDIHDQSGASVFKGAIFPGPATQIYNVPALKAGSYPFQCDVHPTMTGTLTIQ